MPDKYTAKTEKGVENKSAKLNQELSSETPTNEEIGIYMLYRSLYWRGERYCEPFSASEGRVDAGRHIIPLRNASC